MLCTGLPATHFPYVKKIEPGLPLFLFNYNDRMLHGIYEAAGHGMMNINPYAWTSNDGDVTGYPAQVLQHRLSIFMVICPYNCWHIRPILKRRR